MSDHPENQGRRRFLRFIALGAAAVPMAQLLFAGSARAAEKVDPNGPTAKALQYSENAGDVSHDAYAPGQQCANCQLYTASAGEPGWGACGAFGGKLVKAEGWCTAYVAAS